MTKMLGKAQNAFSPNLNFLRLAIFKILPFKVNEFPLTSVLVFRLTFRNGLNLFEKQLIYNSLPLTITLTHTFIESYEQVETF